MKNSNFTLFLIIILFSSNATAQKEIVSFIFGHSLIHHEFQVNPTPSQETSIPHWIHFLSQQANHQYKVSGQYGFLPQHANLPPIAQWGFDYAEGAWDSDNEPFSAADFNTIIITPGNFIQWQEPTENYPSETISPISATETVFEWCNQQEAGLHFYIYENWPDMASFLNNGFPPNQNEWDNYNHYLNNEFHDWFIQYHDLLAENFPDVCVKMIPVGPIISTILTQAPFNQILIEELYEDDAPHGRPNIYFLASLITYMATYEEIAPMDYQVDPIISTVIRENYLTLVDIIWEELNAFNFSNGDSRVFCDTPLTNLIDASEKQFKISLQPNPVRDQLTLSPQGVSGEWFLYNELGQLVLQSRLQSGLEVDLSVAHLPRGLYFWRMDEAFLSGKILVQ